MSEATDIFIKHVPEGVIYDLGCGSSKRTARIAHELPDRNNIIGVDKNSGRLADLNRMAQNVETVRADLREFFFPGSCCAAGIVCANMLHFLEPDHRRRLMSDCLYSTDWSGVNLIKVFTNNGQLSIDDDCSFGEEELLRLYEGAGWEVLFYDEVYEYTLTQDPNGGGALMHEVATIVARKPSSPKVLMRMRSVRGPSKWGRATLVDVKTPSQ